MGSALSVCVAGVCLLRETPRPSPGQAGGAGLLGFRLLQVYGVPLRNLRKWLRCRPEGGQAPPEPVAGTALISLFSLARRLYLLLLVVQRG